MGDAASEARTGYRRSHRSRNVHGDVVIFEAWSEQRGLAETLALALGDVTDEIRSIDLLDLVSFVRFENYPALEDLLQASTELFFRPGTLTFGWMARVEVGWSELPAVTFAMEFRHDPVTVFFELTLDGTSRRIAVIGTQFEEACRHADDRLACLAAALATARVPRRTAVAPRLPRR